MIEAFVRTIKRDCVHVSPRPNTETVMRRLSVWFCQYNELHRLKAFGYRTLRAHEFIKGHESP